MPVKEDSGLVVVIDDGDFIREMMCNLLEMAGFRAVGCSDGAEGLKAARELRPSLITLDLHMAGMDGVEVLDRLSLEESTAELPVIVVSAYVPDPQLISHRQVKGVIQKPFDVDELWWAVSLAASGASQGARVPRRLVGVTTHW